MIQVAVTPTATLAFNGPGTKSVSLIVDVDDPSAAGSVPVPVYYNGQTGEGTLAVSYTSTEAPQVDVPAVELALAAVLGRPVTVTLSAPVKVSNTQYQYGMSIAVA